MAPGMRASLEELMEMAEEPGVPLPVPTAAPVSFAPPAPAPPPAGPGQSRASGASVVAVTPQRRAVAVTPSAPRRSVVAVTPTAARRRRPAPHAFARQAFAATPRRRRPPPAAATAPSPRTPARSSPPPTAWEPQAAEQVPQRPAAGAASERSASPPRAEEMSLALVPVQQPGDVVLAVAEEDYDDETPVKRRRSRRSDFAELRGLKMEQVPLDAFDADPADCGGRPKRRRMAPLEHWRNEQVEYERLPGSAMPTVKAVYLNCCRGEGGLLALLDRQRPLALADRQRILALEDRRPPAPPRARRPRRLALEDGAVA